MVDELTFALGVLGMMLTLLSITAAAVWVVAQIKGEGQAFRAELKGLSGEVKRLSTSVDGLDAKLDEHSDRIARLEEQKPWGGDKA